MVYALRDEVQELKQVNVLNGFFLEKYHDDVINEMYDLISCY